MGVLTQCEPARTVHDGAAEGAKGPPAGDLHNQGGEGGHQRCIQRQSSKSPWNHSHHLWLDFLRRRNHWLYRWILRWHRRLGVCLLQHLWSVGHRRCTQREKVSGGGHHGDGHHLCHLWWHPPHHVCHLSQHQL